MQEEIRQCSDLPKQPRLVSITVRLSTPAVTLTAGDHQITPLVEATDERLASNTNGSKLFHQNAFKEEVN